MFWVCRKFVDLSKPLEMLRAFADLTKVTGETTSTKLKTLATANPETIWSPEAKAFLDKLNLGPATQTANPAAQREPVRQRARDKGAGVDVGGCVKGLVRAGAGYFFWEIASLRAARSGLLSLLVGVALTVFQNRWKLVIASVVTTLLLITPLHQRLQSWVDSKRPAMPQHVMWLPRASFAVLGVLQLVGKFKFVRILQEDASTATAVATVTAAVLILALVVGDQHRSVYKWGFGRRLRFVAYVTSLVYALVWQKTDWVRLLGPVLIDAGVILISSLTAHDTRQVCKATFDRLSRFAKQGVANDMQTASVVLVKAVSEVVEFWQQPSTLTIDNAIAVLKQARTGLLTLVAQKADISKALSEALEGVRPPNVVGVVGLAVLSFPSSLVVAAFSLQYGKLAIAALPFVISEAVEALRRYQCLDGGLEDGLDMLLLSSPLLRLWRITKQSLRQLLKMEARVTKTATAINGVLFIGNFLMRFGNDVKTNGLKNADWETHAQDAPALLGAAGSIHQFANTA